MSDRNFFALLTGITVLMLLWALVWPQGLGARSPGPLGHATAAEQAAKAQRAKPADVDPGLHNRVF